MKDYLVQAIKKLKPNSEFSYSGNDYSTINWVVLEGTAPTQSEIDATIEQLKIEEINAEAIKAEAKAVAQAKLAALGLTADDLKALGL